jgi:hypothetical protein
MYTLHRVAQLIAFNLTASNSQQLTQYHEVHACLASFRTQARSPSPACASQTTGRQQTHHGYTQPLVGAYSRHASESHMPMPAVVTCQVVLGLAAYVWVQGLVVAPPLPVAPALVVTVALQGGRGREGWGTAEGQSREFVFPKHGISTL